MNPIALLALKSSVDAARSRHPKFIQFLKAILQSTPQEGSLLECRYVTPDGQELKTNVKLTKEDLELLEKLQKLRNQPPRKEGQDD